ncbi:hypothetical protein FA10DRAFT_267511 [Acaromyces ingoldii]|uniref:DUF1275 domain protein n=1 Tax=Acaromyces ingoldii TaxID=215250 RepID=A0A316YJ96_9BASI|nr:hypothetical protein FA10DRAFT_267511 [Acaromyces ingoldii]PWN88884.1 hypothetical protein FA10DRAFT_267511 [Acaromyces ingoldii]
MSRPETSPLLGHRSSPSRLAVWKERLSEEVDVDDCGSALTAQCVIAGAADAAAYGQTGTWVAFMTGNLTQLTMSATTIGMTRPSPESSVNRLMLSGSSVLGFIVGAFVAMHLDRRFGSRSRGKLASMAVARAAVCFVVAAWVAWEARRGHGWDGWIGAGALALLAINMGSMAVNAQKVGNGPYATTVVFTATLAQLFSDPLLPFAVSSASLKRAKSIFGLILGAALSQAIMILTPRLTETREETRLLKEASSYGSAYALIFVGIVEVVAVGLWLRVKPAAAAATGR